MKREYYIHEVLGLMEGGRIIKIEEFTGRCKKEIDNSGLEIVWYEVVVGYSLFRKKPKIKWVPENTIRKHDYYPITTCDEINKERN